jgi:hypothetical protein
VKIDIRQAVNQRFPLVDDHALEAIAPKIAPAVVKPVVYRAKPTLISRTNSERLDSLSRQ